MRSFYRFMVLFLLLVPSLCMAQGSKTLKKNNVSSQVTYEYFLSEGKKEPVIEKLKNYDAEGNITELKVFNKTGDVKQWEKYSYDEDGEIIEEQFLDGKGRIIERIEYVYENKLVQEKRYYDNRGRETKRKTYSYQYREELTGP